ncbi:MAG: DNA-3-methyladenine glycosylase I [Betaproteobacteria bacterium]|nr:MAG: DNA-3-methyladenine glycosylase I [Betaproteobacteria bacterium]
MKSFESINKDAVRKHGERVLNSRLPNAKSARALYAVTDGRYLSEMAKCIFQAGFVWKVVDKLWLGFEEVFLRFSPKDLVDPKPRQIDSIKQDRRIIRNAQKIKAVLDSARFVSRVSSEHGGFGKFIARWPGDDLAGLWNKLSREGSSLGGITGPRFLRNVGKDTYIFSPDGVKELIATGVISKAPASKTALTACHQAFSRWHDESGRRYCDISMVVACSV